MILSTGMAEWHEIDETVETLRPINDQIVLMNCVSEYPAKHADVNLNVIREMHRYDVIVGHSDHTPDIYTSIAAVAVGAKLIEKHFILDRRQPGPDQSVSIEPYELYELVKAVRRVEEALGGSKKVHDLEKPIRSWAHRSVVSLRPIAKVHGSPRTWSGPSVRARESRRSIWTKSFPAPHLRHSGGPSDPLGRADTMRHQPGNDHLTGTGQTQQTDE